MSKFISMLPDVNLVEIHLDDIAKTWAVGLIYSRNDLFGPKVKWLDHVIRLNIKPGDYWQESYGRQFGRDPESRMRCYYRNV